MFDKIYIGLKKAKRVVQNKQVAVQGQTQTKQVPSDPVKNLSLESIKLFQTNTAFDKDLNDKIQAHNNNLTNIGTQRAIAMQIIDDYVKASKQARDNDIPLLCNTTTVSAVESAKSVVVECDRAELAILTGVDFKSLCDNHYAAELARTKKVDEGANDKRARFVMVLKDFGITKTDEVMSCCAFLPESGVVNIYATPPADYKRVSQGLSARVKLLNQRIAAYSGR